MLLPDTMAEGAMLASAVAHADCLNRYQCQSSEDDDAKGLGGKTNYLLKCEKELTSYFSHKFGLGVASGGIAIMLGLKAIRRVVIENLGHAVDDQDIAVYSNAFTFNAVPSAIVNAGFKPSFVQTRRELTLDWEDLERIVLADKERGIRHHILVLSYMRGRVPDMDAVLQICNKYNVHLLEDNAHGYGAAWRGRKTGSFGLVSTISTQANKLINTGEGGFIFTSDDAIQAYCMFAAGCYEERYQKHESLCPTPEAIEAMCFSVANFSCRMSNVSAALAYPQVVALQRKIDAHNSNYYLLQQLVAEKLVQEYANKSEGKFAVAWEMLEGMQSFASEQDRQDRHAFPLNLIEFIPQIAGVDPVFDSLQMRLATLSSDACQHMCVAMNKAGFRLQPFAKNGDARYYRSWRFCIDAGDVDAGRFQQTDRVLRNVVDMRLSAHDTKEDVEFQASTIVDKFLGAVAACGVSEDLSGPSCEKTNPTLEQVLPVRDGNFPMRKCSTKTSALIRDDGSNNETKQAPTQADYDELKADYEKLKKECEALKALQNK